MAQENEISVWETKFPEHSPENRFPLYNLYKIPLAQANFPLAHKNALLLASGLHLLNDDTRPSGHISRPNWRAGKR